MENRKGMLCYIFKSPLGDCTLNGLSSKHDDCLLIIDNERCEVFEQSEERPTFKLIKKSYSWGDYVYAQPIGEGRAGTNDYMAGGNFLYTSDSRFREYANDYPIPIHDRQEKNKESEVLSR